MHGVRRGDLLLPHIEFGADACRVRAEPERNLAVTPKSDGLPEAVVIRPGQAAGMRAAGLPTYVSHFAACPMADEFRRKARHKSTVDTYRRNAAARSRARRA